MVEMSEKSFMLYMNVLLLKQPADSTFKMAICKFIIVQVCFLAECCLLCGCSDKEEYLIRVNNSSVLTVADFKEAFNALEAALPHNEKQSPVVLRHTLKRFLKQAAEELILLERAKELEIFVNDSEVSTVVEQIKDDYPEGTFEQIFLENAVSYNLWRKNLKIRLIKEKLIKKELEDNIIITEEEIADHYEKYFKKNAQQKSLKNRPEQLNKKIETILRKKKAEDAFVSWIKKLRQRYTVEINEEQLKALINLKHFSF